MAEPVSPQPAPDDLPVSHRLGWTAFLQRSTDALFVLNRRRQVRFVNQAWEALTGWSAARAHGLRCVRLAKKHRSKLGAALDPPAEVWQGGVARVRRPVPPHRSGPPWWDVTFFPLRDADGLLGVIGRIEPIGGRVAYPPPPKVPTFLRERAAARWPFGLWPADRPPWGRVLAQAHLAAAGRGPVLLQGPAGSGKLWLARAVHFQGVTRELTFLTVDCLGLPPADQHELLFGRQGLERPERLGTVYLRGAEHLPRDLQLRLTEWLAEQGPAAGPRLVAGCRLDPAQAVRAGRLLDEFFQAVAVVTIRLPALRDHRADLPEWVGRVLYRLNEGHPPELAPDALEALAAHEWPGNLRELTAVLADAATRAAGRRVERADLPSELRLAADLARQAAREPEPDLNVREFLERMERRLIDLALQRARGQREKAAKMLGVPRAWLWRRLRELGIPADEPEA